MGLRQVLRTNPNAATKIWTPSQVSNFKSISGGSVEDSFMPSKPHVPNFSPLGFMGLAHKSCLERF